MNKIERIKKICCQEMGLPYAHLTTNRKVPAPFTKMIICYFFRYALGLSKYEIGKALKLDRTTVHKNLKEKLDTKILLSIQEKIDDPNFKPIILKEKIDKTCKKNGKVYEKQIKELPEKLYGRNLKEIDTEIDALVKEMKTASYDKCLEMSRRLDVLSIRKLNEEKDKKQNRITKKVSTKKLDTMRIFIG